MFSDSTKTIGPLALDFYEMITSPHEKSRAHNLIVKYVFHALALHRENDKMRETKKNASREKAQLERDCNALNHRVSSCSRILSNTRNCTS